jgi:F0F1-type ATP synthase membrane subunit b/b'
MAIDTLQVAKRLREAGFTDPQAEALTAAVQQASEGADLATKGDIAEARTELKAEITELRAEFRAEIATLHSEQRESELRLEAKIRESELRLEAKIEAMRSDMQALKADIMNRVFGLILGALTVNIIAMIGAVFAVAKLLGH